MARPFGIRNKKQNDNNKTTIRWSSNDRCDLAHSRVVQILRKSKSATCSYHVDFRDVTDAWDEHSYTDFHWVSYAHATDKCVDKCDDMCIRLHTIPALDRQTQTGRRTDGRTDGRIFRNNIALCMHHNASTRFTWNLERVQESFYIIRSNRPELKINPLLVEISLSGNGNSEYSVVRNTPESCAVSGQRLNASRHRRYRTHVLETMSSSPIGFHSFIHSFIYLLRITSTNKTMCNAMSAGQQGSKTNTNSCPLD